MRGYLPMTAHVGAHIAAGYGRVAAPTLQCVKQHGSGKLTVEINQLERDIGQRVAVLVPSLVAIPGCGALTAGKLIVEAADITRFKSRDACAMWAGVAPIPVWSANNTRFRLNRGGNRQSTQLSTA